MDGIRDGRIRVINTGTGAHYLNYQEGTDQDDALFGGGMLNGLADNDVLTGSNDIYNIDVLDGGDGADTLNGGQGMDILVGGAGADQLNGGDNFDIVSYAPASAGLVVNMANVAQNTGDAAGDGYAAVEGIVGSQHNDRIIGNNSGNRLEGGDGNDTLEGAGGGDTLYGDDGDDLLIGGNGGDTFEGGAGRDTVSYATSLTAVQVYLWAVNYNVGALGDTYKDIEVIVGTRFNDVIDGDTYENTFFGDAGDDRLGGQGGSDTLYGGDGSDILDGGWGDWADRLEGGSGYDYASYAYSTSGVVARLMNPGGNTAEAAGDVYDSIEGLHGSRFDDTLGGSAEANYLFGRAGNDTVYGEAGNDSLFGEDGNDNLVGGAGADALDGGAGYDAVDYFAAASDVRADLLESWRNTGEAQGDSYVSIEGINGSSYGDDLRGSHEANGLYGNAGNDILEGRGGADLLHGGEGEDYAAYWSAASGVRASLLNSAINAGDAAGDSYVSIEGLQGSGFGDMLQGNGAGNLLNGQGGNDELRGEGGHDWIVGGAGHDTLIGGEGADWLEGQAGADVFRFEAGLGQVDQVADFNGAEGDRIALSTNLFRAFAPVVVEEGYTLNATLKAAAFVIGSGATTTTHRIVYNQGTGALSYDADGVGGAAQVQFAQPKAGAILSAAHFQMFTL
ncbi:calcium-binding protein [Microvirga sp. 0TCS3.31]